MAATRRLGKELQDFRESDQKNFKNIIVDESNILFWKALICPDNPPYNKGAFKIEITFPPEYPFKQPTVVFKTKIYHPNVDEKGKVCLPIISPENWKPHTRSGQILAALVALIHDPDPVHFIREDIAHEFTTDKKKFMKNAEEHTKRYSEKRPA